MFQSWGDGTAAEKAELNKIYAKVVASGGQGGVVAVDILTPDAQPLKNLHVTMASRPGILLQTLQDVVTDLGLKPGETLVQPRPQFFPQDAGPDDLALHLTARHLTEQEEAAPGQFPGESWIVYKASEIPKLLGNTEPSVGAEWEIPAEFAKRLFMHVYPQDTLGNHPEYNRILTETFNARIITVENSIARARLEGTLEMDHVLAPPPNTGLAKRISASFVGYVDFAVKGRQVLAFKLVTFRATSEGREFQVGITSQPQAYAEPVKK